MTPRRQDTNTPPGPSSLTPPQAIDLGMRYQQAGRLEPARELYRRVLEVDAKNVDALHLLGTLAYQTGDHAEAENLIARALTIKPHPQVHYHHGLALEALGRHADAETSYRAALALDPAHAVALGGLGDVLTHQGRIEEATAAYGDAVRLDPRLASAWNGLGNALRLTRKFDEATQALDRALALEPDSPDAILNLGSVAFGRGDLATALEHFRRAAEIDPGMHEAHYNMGTVHQREGRLEDALACFERAIALGSNSADSFTNLGLTLMEEAKLGDAIRCLERAVELAPGSADALSNLGIALREAHRHDEAIACFERALVRDPEHAVAVHFVNVLRGVATAAPPTGYVRDLFDAYADRFDRHLLEKLGYRAPELLGEALARTAPPPGAPGETLDLGCGTGLMAPHLKPLSRRLKGVDLSPRMLRRARALGLYDELEELDLIACLERSSAATFDLVTAADVFVYLGALERVFAQLARVMRPAGRFAFSVERGEAAAGFELAPSGRYRHSRAYVEALARENGLRVVEARDAVLRREADREIEGMVFVLARDGGSTSA